MSYKIFLMTLNFLLFSHFLCDGIIGQEKQSITFKKTSTIEGDEKNFIGSPVDIIANNDLVFFADAMDMKIKVFTSKGEFVRAFGNRGRGPGEFQHFTKIWLNQKNNIVVVDYFNNRFSFFNQKGELLKEKLFDSAEIQWPRYFERMPLQRTLVKYSKKINPKQIFHIWNSDFTSIEYEFSMPKDLNYDDFVKEMSLTFNLGATTILNETLFHAPFFYEGKLYVTHLSESNMFSGWNTFEGYKPEGSAYIQLGSNESLKNDAQENIYDYRINSDGRSVAFRLNNGTNSLFTTKEGYVAHLFEIRDGTQKKQGVQIFSSKGEFLGYTFYNTKEIRDDQYTMIIDYPKTIDEKNRVYSVDYRGEAPVINVYQLSIE